MKLIFKSITLLTIALFVAACSSNNNEEDDFQKNMQELIDKKVQQDTLGAIDLPVEILKAIPSPLQLTSALKSGNVPYNSRIVNENSNLSNYNSSFSKALNLGVYGSDLGYINFYEKNSDAIKCVKNIKQISEDLKVSQFFNFEMISRLAQHSDNIDSLIYISATAFSDMDNYLKKNNRRNISALVLYGGWLESMHLLVNCKNDITSLAPILKERIGEQKMVVDNMLLIMEVYKLQPKYSNLYKDLEDLKMVFNNVDIEYTEGKTEKRVVDGILQFIETKTSTVVMTDETLKQIKQKVGAIRNTII